MTKKRCVLPRLVRRGDCGASETPEAPSPAVEGCSSGAAAAVVASEPATSASLPLDLSLVSLQPDLAAWASDSANGLDSVLQSLLVPGFEWPAAPIDRTCKYRKGRCSQPRTRKKNGDLHSYCDHHRQKSIQNQRTFDRKRRLQRIAGLTKPSDSASPPTRAEDSDVSSSPCSLNDGEVRAEALISTESPEHSDGDTPAEKRSRAACAIEDQGNDGTCRCGKKCKDVRYDINFITGTAPIV